VAAEAAQLRAEEAAKDGLAADHCYFCNKAVDIDGGEKHAGLKGTDRLLCNGCIARQRNLLFREGEELSAVARPGTCAPECTGCLLRRARPTAIVTKSSDYRAAQRAVSAPTTARAEDHCYHCGKTIPHGEARGELAGTNRMLCDSCRQRQRRLLTRGATLPPRAAACPPDCTGCIMRMKRPAVQRPDSAATAQRAARAPPGARTANHCFLCGTTDLPSARYRRLGGTNRMACEACRGWHQWCVSTGKPLPQRVAPCPADSCTGCTFPSARNQQ